MKAEIYYDDGKWSWKIKQCGIPVARGWQYTCKSSAKRGLRRFLESMEYALAYPDSFGRDK